MGTDGDTTARVAHGNCRRAAVIVSGGGAISPFTTPDAGCVAGLSAGSTDTGLREGLLAHGVPVFTAPANVVDEPAAADPGANGFAEPPTVLPVAATINSFGTVDAAGERLDSFLQLLADEYGVIEVDLVCHSMGGLFARSAIRRRGITADSPRVTSLTTIGTPWQGSHIADVANGVAPSSVLGDEPVAMRIVDEFRTWLAFAPPDGAGVEVGRHRMMGAAGWNARQGDVLGDLPVTLIAGDGLRADGIDSPAFPHDALVDVRSALALDLPDTVVRPRARHTVPDVHSIHYADALGLPWDRAITWDSAVVSLVVDALRIAGHRSA